MIALTNDRKNPKTAIATASRSDPEARQKIAVIELRRT
jgi:hypothetical protein